MSRATATANGLIKGRALTPRHRTLVRKTLRYYTSEESQTAAERSLAALAEELGYPPREACFRPDGNGFEVSFVVEIPDPVDSLFDQVQRVLEESFPACQVSLEACDGFADLYWQPVSRREMWIPEIVRLNGARRYGVVGFLNREFRICVSNNEDQPYEAGFVAAEPDLGRAVTRVIRFIEFGPEDALL